MIRKLGLVVLVIAVIALQGIGLVARNLAADQTLNVGLEAEVSCLDPHLGFDAAQDLCVRQYIYDRLVHFENPGLSDWEVTGGLAESWEMSDDGKTIVFNLRQGVQFHGGYGEFTSEDVAFSIERVKSDVSSFASQDQWTNIESVATPDKYTAVIKLTASDPMWLAKVAYLQGGPFIVSKVAVQALGEDHKMNPVGTGPFKFDSYVPGESLTLVKTDDYWGGEWIIDKMVFNFIEDDNARTLGLLSGELDVVKGLGDDKWIELVKNSGAVVEFFGPSVVPTVSFKLTNDILANKKVRLAIIHAIDRDVVALAQGQATVPVYGALHPSWKLATDDVTKYEHDPVLARQYLAEAGYPDGFDIEVYSSERIGYLRQYTIIQEQLRQVGINMIVNVVDHSTYWANNFGDLNPIVITGYIQFPTAAVWLRAFGHSASIVGKPGASFNFSHYGDLCGSIDDLLASAEGQPEDVQRDLYKQAQQQIVEDLPFFDYIGSLSTTGLTTSVDLGYAGELSSRGGFWVRVTKDTAKLAK